MKRKPSPITPILFFLLLIPILSIFGYKLYQTTKSYKENGNTEIILNLQDQILKLEEETTLDLRKKQTSYSNTLSNDIEVMKQINQLISYYSDLITLTKNNVNYDNQDFEISLNRWKVLNTQLELRINAISLYINNQKLNTCLKGSIKTENDLNKCWSLFNNLNKLSDYDQNLYNTLSYEVSEYLDSYFNFTKTDRVNVLNRIVKIQNLFNKILEKEINKN